MAVKVGLCGDTENSEQVRIGRPVPDHWIGLSWYVASVRRGTDHEARASLEAAGVPVLKELQVIYMVSGEPGWQEFQDGLAKLDRKTLDAEPGKTWDIPVDLFEFVNNAAGDGAGGVDG